MNHRHSITFKEFRSHIGWRRIFLFLVSVKCCVDTVFTSEVTTSFDFNEFDQTFANKKHRRLDSQMCSAISE